MNCLGLFGSRLACIVFCFIVFVAILGNTQPVEAAPSDEWTVAEYQPNIPNGGRLNTFAVKPGATNVVIAASETGGLFRSRDNGENWQHVDALPCFRTNSVAYYPSNADILIATTTDDWKGTTGGGIWRSTDSGATWTQATMPAGVASRLWGYEISISPSNGNIYVGCSSGLLVSNDQGGSWSLQRPFGFNASVISVVAMGGDRLVVGGPDGLRYSSNGGMNWNTPTTSAGSVTDIHALGRSPMGNQHAYLANANRELYFTTDGGDHWNRIVSAPAGGGGCGGILFVKAVKVRRRAGFLMRDQIELYYGNRCSLSRLICPIRFITNVVDYSGSWANLAADHADTRDLCFMGTRPYLLGTDGGIHKTTNGGASWSFVGGGTHGYNALQITEIQGQYIEDIDRHDLYFGTQDNYLWASSDEGETWPTYQTSEGFFIECQKTVATATDSKITFTACAPCVRTISDPLFANSAGWSNPAGRVVGDPMILRQNRHLQGVDDPSMDNPSPFVKGLASTSNLGSSWRQWASFPADRRDLPKLGLSGGGLRSEAVYQAIRTGWNEDAQVEIWTLARMVKRRDQTAATVYYPAMNNFGGLGTNPTMFAWYQVYAVDPGDYLHLIAPDVANERMMESHDGGENWTEMPALTDLVTDGGRLLFRSNIIPEWDPSFPIVTAISFCPADPRYVLVGTSEGGVYLSEDNGATWSKLPNSEGVTFATGFHWLNTNDVIASTYGRGLWRIQHHVWIPRPDLPRLCHPCIEVPWRIPPEPPWDRGILVFNGRVMGARGKSGIMREVFVSRGASIAFLSDEQRFELKVTRTNKNMGFHGVGQAPDLKTGQISKGLLFRKDNRLVATLAGDKENSLAPSPSQKEIEGSTQSPIAGKPYLHLRTSTYAGGPVAMSSEEIEISGVNFSTGDSLSLEMDGTPVSKLYDMRVDEEGNFKAVLQAPFKKGIHRIEVKSNGQVIDGVMFLVKHEDRDELDEQHED